MTQPRLRGIDATPLREFLYLEGKSGTDFDALFEVHVDGEPVPSAGGAMEENTRVAMPDGAIFYGVSYKGDIPGWRGRYIYRCEKRGLRWASIRGNDSLVLSDGTTWPIENCGVERW